MLIKRLLYRRQYMNFTGKESTRMNNTTFTFNVYRVKSAVSVGLDSPTRSAPVMI